MPRPTPAAAAAAATCLSLIVSLLAPAVAWASAWASMKGKVIISDQEFSTGYGSDAELLKAVKKQAKTTLKGEGAWTMNLMVFLKEAAGADTINIVYYDVTKKREQVNFSEIKVQPSQKIVQVNGVAVTKDTGFVKGHRYEVLATRLINNKEKIYAKGIVTLK
jgi:hypothetical protein